jgi:hypothetical protein
MKTVRTTLKINKNLKLTMDRYALENGITLQEILNRAIEEYLDKIMNNQPRKIVFYDQPIGGKINNLTRSDYYED